MNAYCISKLYADWTTDGAKTAHSEVLTEENVLTIFDEMMKNMDNKRVPRAGRILYVTPVMLAAVLMQSRERSTLLMT